MTRTYATASVTSGADPQTKPPYLVDQAVRGAVRGAWAGRVQTARHLNLVSVSEVLHIIILPVLVRPSAPAGLQKAPGVTPERIDGAVVWGVLAVRVVVVSDGGGFGRVLDGFGRGLEGVGLATVAVGNAEVVVGLAEVGVGG